MADFERVRKVNLERASKMPNFVADGITRNYRSDGVGQPWKLFETIESEITVNEDGVTRRNIRRNGVPWKPAIPPGLRAGGGLFGFELGVLDSESDCSAQFDFVGIVAVGGKQLRAYRFSAPSGCCFRVETNKTYKPAMVGRFLVDPVRAEVLRYESESAGFPDKFGVDRVFTSQSWDYITIGGSSYLVPVMARMIEYFADGRLWSWLIEYRNHRHFEAAAHVTYSPGK